MAYATHTLAAWCESAGHLHLTMAPRPGDAERGAYIIVEAGSGDWPATQAEAGRAMAADVLAVTVTARATTVTWRDGTTTQHATRGDAWADLVFCAGQRHAARREAA